MTSIYKHTYESLYLTIKEQYSRTVKETDGEEWELKVPIDIKKEERSKYYNKIMDTYNNPSASAISEVLSETVGIKKEQKEIDNTYVYLSAYK